MQPNTATQSPFMATRRLSRVKAAACRLNSTAWRQELAAVAPWRAVGVHRRNLRMICSSVPASVMI